jgi:copper(I)-binding protein
MTRSDPSRRTLATRITSVVLGAVLLAGLTACGPAAQGDEQGVLEVVDPFLDLPPNPSLAAVRLEIANGTGTADALVAVSSTDGEASLHRSDLDDAGRSVMTPVDRIVVPARSTVVFEPGGLHLMLDDIERELQVGDVVPFDLVFEHGGTVSIEVPVVEPLSRAADDHDDHQSAPPRPRPAGALR